VSAGGLAGAPSRVPDPRCSAANRVDPYWAGVWNPGGVARWSSRAAVERLVEMGLAAPPRASGRRAPRSVEQAVRDLVESSRRGVRLSALAGVGMWRTVTSQQLAAITGCAALASRFSDDRRVLWESGLVDEGRFLTGLDASSAQVRLFRPERSADFNQLSERLSYSDWVGVTGGVGWRWGNQADRHNVLGTELGLRAAEYTDVACVLGESMAGIGHLAAAVGAEVKVGPRRAADVVLLRADGMVIAVEITASADANLRTKVENWSRVLLADKAKKLVVLFVECAHPDFAAGNGEAFRQLRKTVVAAANPKRVDAVMADLDQRMLVARWTDWFPGAGRVDPGFHSLECWRPSGRREERWEQVSLLDPFAFPFEGRPEVEDLVLRQCRSLYGVPYWLREAPLDYSAVIRRLHSVTETPRLPYWRNYRPVEASV
jgi:hypothetical protein